MHVVLVASWYKSPESPVVGSFIEEQARALMAQGVRVAVLHPQLRPFGARLRGGARTVVPEELELDDGLPTIRVAVSAPVPRWGAPAYWLLGARAAAALRRHALTHGMPDVLHAHSTFHGGVAGVRLARLFGRPLVLTEHLSAIVEPGWPARRHEEDVLRRTAARADRVIAVSSALRDGLARHGVDPARVEVVPNLVDPRFFSEAPPPESPAPIVFGVSHLVPRKRMDLLIRAVAVARRSEPGLLLRIGGDGPERPRLQALIAQLGLGSHVRLLGALSREDVVRELRACHAFALASAYETFGVVVAEALASGRPVVATDSLGVRDVLGPGDGVLVGSAEPEALAQALLRVLRDPWSAADLSRRCRERFGPERVARRLCAIYDDLAGRSAARA